MRRKRTLVALSLASLVGASFVGGFGVGAYRETRHAVYDAFQGAREALLPSSPRNFASDVHARRLETTLQNFDLVWVNPDVRLPQEGGGMAVFDDAVLVARPADGALLLLEPETGVLQRTALRLPPINRDLLPDRTPGGSRIRKDNLRYNDLEVVATPRGRELLVSYSYFHPDRRCVTSRLAAHPAPAGPSALLDAEHADGAWRVVFESDPCLPFFEHETRNALSSHQAGGRLARKADGGVLLTMGDHEYDGVGGKLPLHSQDPRSSYGKILRLDPADWSVETVSIGHRNPQGIVASPKGYVLSVEHGPRGGDELNLVERGANYGWPLETLGVDYGPDWVDARTWPFNDSQGRHERFRAPLHAWVPSIGISNLKVVEGVTPRWEGDYLAGSLVGRALVRIRLTEGRVLYTERIEIGERIRYLEVGHGRIYLLTDSGLVGMLLPRDADGPDAPDGLAPPSVSALVQNRCLVCHSKAGLPRLDVVYGAPIASGDGVGYSAALSRLDGVWDEESLGRFLSDPDAFAPGTMVPGHRLPEREVVRTIEALRALGVAGAQTRALPASR
ncbi:PQQ-dependent sugar dehydrogenase [Salinarimonas chemoclinalis]|uniref:PQQ-dependent sugar dehydrogenase n=1 Tax=Salinarimonas chemoclinalis TaxID=3241599 RepID=UPI0035575076